MRAPHTVDLYTHYTLTYTVQIRAVFHSKQIHSHSNDDCCRVSCLFAVSIDNVRYKHDFLLLINRMENSLVDNEINLGYRMTSSICSADFNVIAVSLNYVNLLSK